jgi:RimJ/RimL family protein N-acetyltransferase
MPENISIRPATENDAQQIIDFARILFASTDQVLTTPEEYTITPEEEKAWIRKAQETPACIILIAVMENKVVGLLDFFAKPRKKIAHTGEFGVSVHPEYQEKGIGKRMVGALLKWAEQEPQIEKVCLQVFDTNHHAIRLYKSLGFVEEGRQVKAAKQASGQYIDIIQMHKFV